MTDTFLNRQEIEHLTDRLRRSAQVRVLKSMHVEHRVRPDGSIAILRAHIAKVFDGNADGGPRQRHKTAGPNWAAI